MKKNSADKVIEVIMEDAQNNGTMGIRKINECCGPIGGRIIISALAVVGVVLMAIMGLYGLVRKMFDK